MTLAGASLAMVAFPVTATVAAAIALAKITDMVRERESNLQKARTLRKQLIDGQADQVRDAFVAVAREQGNVLIDAVEAYLAQHRLRLQRTLAQIVRRIEAPDSVASREIVARLGPVEESGREIIAGLRELANEAAAQADQATSGT